MLSCLVVVPMSPPACVIPLSPGLLLVVPWVPHVQGPLLSPALGLLPTLYMAVNIPKIHTVQSGGNYFYLPLLLCNRQSPTLPFLPAKNATHATSSHVAACVN